MTISEQIIQVLDHLCAKFGIVIDWTQENIMPYIEQLAEKFIRYEVATSIFWIVLMVVLLAIGWIVFAIVRKVAVEDIDAMIVVGIIAGVLSVAAIGVIGTQVYDIITAKVFPEKTLFDAIQSMISNASYR